MFELNHTRTNIQEILQQINLPLLWQTHFPQTQKAPSLQNAKNPALGSIEKQIDKDENIFNGISNHGDRTTTHHVQVLHLSKNQSPHLISSPNYLLDHFFATQS